MSRHFANETEHKHNEALEREYWNALVSMDSVSGLTHTHCEFSMALFHLAAHILSTVAPDTRRDMLDALRAKAEMIVAEREVVDGVVALVERARHGGKAH